MFPPGSILNSTPENKYNYTRGQAGTIIIGHSTIHHGKYNMFAASFGERSKDAYLEFFKHADFTKLNSFSSVEAMKDYVAQIRFSASGMGAMDRVWGVKSCFFTYHSSIFGYQLNNELFLSTTSIIE
jgi:hypothetical protein